jgi:hypothetical protein
MLHMDPAHKKDTKLGDQIYNVDGLYVVSVKVRAMIDGAKPPLQGERGCSPTCRNTATRPDVVARPRCAAERRPTQADTP